MTQMNTSNLVFLSVTKRGLHAEAIYHLIAWRLGDMDACLDGPIRRFDGQPTLRGGSRPPLIAESCLVILPGSTSSQISIFACEKHLSYFREITTVVPSVTYDNEVEDCAPNPQPLTRGGS